VGAPYDLGNGTNFTDGMVCDGPWSFFVKASLQTFGIVAMHTDGSSEVYSMLAVGDAGRPHVERLGTATGLAEMVIASPGLVGADTMALAPWSAALGLGEPLVVGPGGDDPRLGRTGRGLALTWARDGAILLQVLDCCVVP
jgi:hypothetical protein